MTTGVETAIVPIFTSRGTKLPFAEAASPVNWMDGAEDAVLDTENVAVATTESAKVAVFIPDRRHVEEPLMLLQIKDLPALVALGLAAKLTAVKSAEE